MKKPKEEVFKKWYESGEFHAGVYKGNPLSRRTGQPRRVADDICSCEFG